MGILERLARKDRLQNMPYATSELSEVCIQCKTQKCLKHCPQNILSLNAHHLPSLDFSQEGCTFCGECVSACFEENGEHKGFDLTQKRAQMLMRINPSACLAWNKSICYSCKDVCPQEITFVGMFYPEIISCNGCGFCLSRCPSNAIECYY